MTAIICCDYKEWEPKTYKGFVLDLGDDDKVRFKSKNPLADRNRATLLAEAMNRRPLYSSSCHNFVSDCTVEATK